MRFQLTKTSDGSLTLFDSEAGECFKSRHAAKTEAEAVFYQPGVKDNPWYNKAHPFRIIEFGFGLGTNYLHLLNKQEALEFVSIDRDLAGARYFLEYEPELREILEKQFVARSGFNAKLIEKDFFTALPELIQKGEKFHSVFFDPFSPKSNPEAWSLPLFALAFDLLHPGGRLVTYSVSRAAKDAAQQAGFLVEKRNLPIALQKRNALLATKP